ncbi:hypothetical protein [Breznakiella homolactica]|uniref:hypothetical protein n=1 Tax=Breznakiella homolactica TaxID=2798577 RepID=UPI001CBA699E|nr:hypothetical protein [Breznakiella homolactica]QQO10049.2 hypothetical protein JFL75_03795 [Breznakiella homolactica]
MVSSIRDNVYLLERNNRRYVAKVSNNSFNHFVYSSELYQNTAINDPDSLLSKKIGFRYDGKNYFVLEKYVEGDTDPETIRAIMPGIFYKIGVFHRENKAEGRVWSMYSDGRKFDSIEDMVRYEFSYHESYWEDTKTLDPCLSAVMNLTKGFRTVLHGDLHLGNVILRDSGPVLIDTEWSALSLNMFEFEHVDFFGISRDYSEKVTDNALDCYRAYFYALGINEKISNELIRGYNVLKVMRKNTYDRYYKNYEDLKKIPGLLQRVLAWPASGMEQISMPVLPAAAP